MKRHNDFQFQLGQYVFSVRPGHSENDGIMFIYVEGLQPWQFIRVDRSKETFTIRAFTIGGKEIWKSRVVRGSDILPKIEEATNRLKNYHEEN